MNANKILPVVFILSAVLTWILPPFKTKIKHDSEGIVEKVFLTVGGVKQGMIIRGNDIENPVLLFLSGGTGLSYGESVPSESMTHAQFLADTFEVTEYLCERFQTNRIYLAAHSFGTSIGIQAVAERPELYKGYIAVSQIADQPRSEQLAYEHMLVLCEQKGNRSLLIQLKKHPFDTESYFTSGTRDRAMHTLGHGAVQWGWRRLRGAVTEKMRCRNCRRPAYLYAGFHR